MRICLLGDISGNLDEGMKNTTYYLFRELSKRNEVIVINPRKAILPSGIAKLKKFKPDILHYIHGSSIRSFLVTKYLASILPKARSIVMITHPEFTGLGKAAIGFFRSDMVIVQSHAVNSLFSEKGFKTAWLSSGVDTEKFSPVPNEKRLELRKKYGLGPDDFVVLHVGHIKANRSLEILINIQQKGNFQILIAGSSAFQAEEKLLEALKNSGCIIWNSYFPNVEEVYQLSDCYIFPVMTDDGAIQIPLTILEAASCNLPVITTSFGGLNDMVGEKEGLFYAQTSEEMLKMITVCKDFNAKPRNWAMDYSWEKITRKLQNLYEELIEES